MKRVAIGLTILLACSCLAREGQEDGGGASPQRTQPGEQVRVVRFMVKAQMRSEFEDFFWSSLKPAAATLASNGTDPVGSFRLLIPDSLNRSGFYTYYVLVDPLSATARSGETMRDMVRAAFPGEEGEQRVRRWMNSIVLGDLAPQGENFTEADLRGERSPN